jgi:MscS family membrane protein
MVILALLIHGVFFHRIGAPILYRYYYSRFLYVLLVLSFTWLLWIIIDRAFERMILRARSATGGAASAESLMIVGRRIARIVLMFIIVLIILPLIGVNPTTALAGVGIGGIVVALAAQKTMENLFGGVSLLMDRVIQVGDVCKIGDRVGTVEDIGLRSIRIRTVEQTELSVPNGALAQVQFENFKGRSKFNLSTTIGLRYETSADQLRVVLADIRRMLYEHPKVETGSARIRFARFGQSALELDLFAYILTSDMPEFMAIREDLHLRMMDIVLAAGTGFAFPSQTVYISQDTGLDSARSETALKRVREWREKQQIPFPDFSRELVADIENKIIYPPADSMVRKPQK